MTVISNTMVKIPERNLRLPSPTTFIPSEKNQSVDSFDARTSLYCVPSSQAHPVEEQFIADLNLSSYGMIAKEFMDNYMNSDNKNFSALNGILIKPTPEELMTRRMKLAAYNPKQLKLEKWHKENAYKFAEELLEADEKTRIRHKKREEEGLGFGGHMSEVNLKGKEIGQFAKNNLTIRGNMVKLNNAMCGKSIYELVPLYAKRKGAKIAIKMTELGLNGILTLTGHALLPFTLGVSKIITDQLSTGVTLSGEAITGKALGATNKKIATHAALRGVQLEIPNVLPGGTLIQIYEMGMDMGGSLTIAAGSIADIVLRNTSKRYASMISDIDLGDEKVLEQMNQRIDYLAQFLIPYGQYLLLKTKNPETRQKLLYIIKEEMKVLRDLERTKTKTLNFYLMALLAERIPADRQAGVEEACRMAVPDTRKNSHHMVRRSLATLLRERPLNV